MTATPANKVLLFLGTCAILALALNAPSLLKGIVVSWDDYAANLLERIAAGGEFALHGFYHRFPAMLSGIDATVNGIDPKLDTLSQRGVDFQSGGTHFDVKGTDVSSEDVHDIGDMLLFRFDIPHWITPVDMSQPCDFSLASGRWTAVLPYR
jgi:hypothetical protein